MVHHRPLAKPNRFYPAAFNMEKSHMKGSMAGADVGAAVLYRAFTAEQDGRRGLVRLWLEVYRQLVEEDRPMEEDTKGT
jgi:hypothetical protein